jgi:hypothetical protein
VKVINNPEGCKDDSITGDNNHSTRIEISERTLAVMAFGFGVAALVTALWSMHETEVHRIAVDRELTQAREAGHREIELQYREVDRLVREVHVCKVTTENHDALMIRAGFKQPGDAPLGPTGNLDFQPSRR